MIGIYKIENLINHKIYVGQSIHIERRLKEHCFPSGDSLISKAIKKYGKENFSFELIEECSLEELNDRESYYIQKFNTVVPNGYNVEEYSESNKTYYINYDKNIILNIVADIKNSTLSFSEIAEKYDTSSRLIYYINKGDVHYFENEKYPLREVEDLSKKSHYCISCGKEISKGSTRCKSCCGILQRKVDRPSKEELFNLLKEKQGNFTQIGKYYGVTDNAVRKWCKQNDLPSHSKDYKHFNSNN